MTGYKAIIKNLLDTHPEYRDDDRQLTLAVWREFGFHLSETQLKLFMRIPQAQIIVRRRREFRNLYPGSETKEEERFEHFEEFQEELTPHAVSWLNDD